MALSKPIPRLTGLDPAAPGFYLIVLPGLHAISKKDAAYVEIIHTSTEGIPSTIGHTDYYPNAGPFQPGCNRKTSCNHGISTKYYALSINGHYVAVKCTLPSSYLLGLCDKNEKVPFGSQASKNVTGKFFLKFNANIGEAFLHANSDIHEENHEGLYDPNIVKNIKAYITGNNETKQ